MKMKIIITLMLLLNFVSSNCQTVNDIPISELDVEYIRIVGTSKFLSTQITVELEFGQRTKFFSIGKETIIKDQNGKPLVFNSMIDALNFMGKYGYEFLTAYALTINNQNVYHYLMRKRLVENLNQEVKD